MAQTWPRIEYWRADDGWRWRRRARNGRIIAASEEGKKNLSRVKKLLHMAFPNDEIIPLGLVKGAK